MLDNQDCLAKRPVRGYAFSVPITIYVDYIINACSQEEAKEKLMKTFDIDRTDITVWVEGNYPDDIEYDGYAAELVPYSKRPQRKCLGHDVFCDEQNHYYFLNDHGEKQIITEFAFDEADFGY